MVISGDLVATLSGAAIFAGVHIDPITLSSDVSGGQWLMLTQIGAYPWYNGTCIPPRDDYAIDNIPFDDLQSSAFVNDPTSQLNEAVFQMGFVSNPDAICPDYRDTAYVTDAYPNLAYSAPGLLASGLTAGDTMNIEWPAGEKRWEGYYAFITRIFAPFDADAGFPIHLDGSTPDSSGTLFNVASGTTSPDATTNAATSAADGHGAVAIVAVSWNDASVTATIPSGWTLLSSSNDGGTYAALVAGRIFDPGDTGPYTFNATFSGSVFSETATDTWQTTGGLHVWKRI